MYRYLFKLRFSSNKQFNSLKDLAKPLKEDEILFFAMFKSNNFKFLFIVIELINEVISFENKFLILYVINDIYSEIEIFTLIDSMSNILMI